MSDGADTGRRTEDGAPSDVGLLRRYVERGDDGAFAALVERNVGLVYAAALRQLGGSVHRARDVTQLVFIDLARKARALARRDDLAGWLYTSAHYAAAKLKRSEQRRAQREQEAQMRNEISGGTSDADWERLRPVLDEAMLALSETDRAALLSRFFQGRRLADVGHGLALSEDAARMRVDRALERLRVVLSRRGITSTSAALAGTLAHPALATAPAGFAATISSAALAGVAGGGGTVTLILMQTTKWFLGAAIVAAIGFGVFEMNRAAQTETQIATLTSERDRLNAQLQAERRRVATAMEKSATLQRDLGAAGKAKPAATASGTMTLGQFGNATVVLTSDAVLKLSPQEQAARDRARAAESTNSTFATLYRLAGWTDAQRQQFRDLMFARQTAEQQLYKDAVAAARAKNPNFDRADQYEIFEAMRAPMEREDQAAVRRAMGDAAAEALERYQDTLPMRFAVRELASSLFATGTPLDQAQAEQLIDILARNARGFDGRVDVLALNVDAAASQAQGLLNEAQLTELRRVIAQAQQRRNQERERNMAPASSLVIKSTGG